MDKEQQRIEKKVKERIRKNYRFCCGHMEWYALDEPEELLHICVMIRTYGLVLPDKTGTEIRYCPWCGVKLPKDLDDEWAETLEKEYGIENPSYIDDEDLPQEFLTEEWWVKRGYGNRPYGYPKKRSKEIILKFGNIEIDVRKQNEIKIPASTKEENASIVWEGYKTNIYKDENLGKLDGKNLFWSKDVDKKDRVDYRLFIEESNRFVWVANIDSDGTILSYEHQSFNNRILYKRDLRCKNY